MGVLARVGYYTVLCGAQRITELERETTLEKTEEQLECPRGFPCRGSDFTRVGKVHVLANGDVLDCLDEDAAMCPFAMSFGGGFFCTCPRRKHLARMRHV